MRAIPSAIASSSRSRSSPAATAPRTFSTLKATAQARLDVDSGGAKAAAVRIEGEALGPDLGSVFEPERDERRAMSVLEVVGESPSPLDRRRSPPRAAVPGR